jgi:hypothetical protein
MPVLSEEEWDSFLSAVAARPREVAALLDGEMPPDLMATARSAGVRLAPDASELTPVCSCPDQGHPCKHAAALGYEAVRVLDADPSALLLIRGRGADAVRDEVERRSTRQPQRVRTGTQAQAPAPAPPGTAHPKAEKPHAPPTRRQLPSTLPAEEVFATSVRPPLPEPLPLWDGPDGPNVPGARPGLPTFPELPGAPSADALTFLASDAATRARHALTAVLVDGPEDADGPKTPDGPKKAEHDPLPELSLWEDTIRLAATHPQLTGRRSLSPLFVGLAQSAGRDPLELARAAAAWRQGGRTGLQVLEAAWDPPAGDFDRGRSALAGLGIAMGIDRNRLTHISRPVQLRYGPDGRWYPYRAASDATTSRPAGASTDWWPEGPAAPDPVRALTGLSEH